MKWLNDSVNHPLRLIAGDGSIIGQFYNSWDKKHHLAEYVPYERPPNKYLCGATGNFSVSRSEHKRRKCADCWDKVPNAIAQGREHCERPAGAEG